MTVFTQKRTFPGISRWDFSSSGDYTEDSALLYQISTLYYFSPCFDIFSPKSTRLEAMYQKHSKQQRGIPSKHANSFRGSKSYTQQEISSRISKQTEIKNVTCFYRHWIRTCLYKFEKIPLF